MCHTCEDVMYLSNSCDNVIKYANVETIFKARRAPNTGLVCIGLYFVGCLAILWIFNLLVWIPHILAYLFSLYTCFVDPVANRFEES